MKNLKLFLFVGLVLVMVVAGCGGGGAATTGPAAAANPTPGTTSNTQGAARATTLPAAEGASDVTTEQDLSLDSVSEGLTQLRSYKSTLTMRFIGKDSQGQAVDSSWTMQEEFTEQPRAQRVVWTTSESTGGQPAVTSGYEVITIGQSTYMITRDDSGTETCIESSSGDATPPEQMLSADMWGSISDAKYVNTETVNGVRAKHYAWDEGTLVTLGYATGKGETWVAVDGGYVVRQLIEFTGKGLFLAGSDEEGTSTWQWDVTDANGSFQIQAPEGCESAATDLPIMAGATDMFTYGDMISYTSGGAFADVVAFYKTEMPNAGWQPSGTPFEGEDFAMLEFTKDERTASVSLSYSASDQTTSVILSVSQP
jgi:hypothetical protein